MKSLRMALTLAVATTGAAWGFEVQKGEIPGVTNFSRVETTIGCAWRNSRVRNWFSKIWRRLLRRSFSNSRLLR